jgi:AcrR family transcriptional regulator
MSPYPSQVSRDTIIDHARELIETGGIDQLTLQKLATTLGIQAPSLYRHVRNKTELLRAVNEVTGQQLVSALGNAVSVSDDPKTRILRMAWACREFALAHPVTYALAYGSSIPEVRPDERQLEILILPIQDVVAELSGEAEALTALRGLWALIHGFVMLEMTDQFRRGGNLDDVFTRTVEAYIRGWEANL